MNIKLEQYKIFNEAARGRTPPRIPASCKKEARKALELRRTVDWEKLKTTIRFEDAGITICAEENEEHLSYTRIKSAFESLHLWLVVCDDECALLLQKKDLRSGNADSFLSDIISKMNTGTDASGLTRQLCDVTSPFVPVGLQLWSSYRRKHTNERLPEG